MTRPRRHQQMPITAAPDIRAASKVNSTGPIPGADRVDPETDPRGDDTDAATDPTPVQAATADAAPSTGSPDEDDPSGESGHPADDSTASSPATGPQRHAGTARATAPVTHRGRTYNAKHGDPHYTVASKHGASVPALAELNRISPRQNLHRGQVLSLPEKNDLPDEDPSHLVAPGETLQGIAARH